MREAVDKDIQKLIKAARKAGWEVRRMGSGHIRLIGPNGQTLSASSTPGTQGSFRDLRKSLQKAGVIP